MTIPVTTIQNDTQLCAAARRAIFFGGTVYEDDLETSCPALSPNLAHTSSDTELVNNDA
jgi:hypothetical protein